MRWHVGVTTGGEWIAHCPGNQSHGLVGRWEDTVGRLEVEEVVMGRGRWAEIHSNWVKDVGGGGRRKTVVVPRIAATGKL